MSEASSQAQYLFEKYSGDGAVDLLKSLPSLPEKTYESDWLDFKSGKSKDEDIKRIWSKIIGAFANSEGGVIVWGIVAKKDPITGIDAVSAIELVPDVSAFKSRLMELRHGACDPPVADIEISELPIPANHKEGFVVCHIPESSMKPHRSEFAGRHFYLRMGDSSRECNVSILRQLFYPKRTPRIEATIKSIRKPPSFNLEVVPKRRLAAPIHAAFEISIRNTGEFTVEEAQIHIESAGYTLFSFNWDEFENHYSAQILPSVVNFGSSIHPKIKQAVNVLLVSDSLQNTQSVFIRVYGKDMPPRDVTLPLPTKEGESTTVECLPK